MKILNSVKSNSRKFLASSKKGFMSEVIAPSHYYDFCGLAILQPLIEGCFLAARAQTF